MTNQEKDEQIIGAILAGGANRPLGLLQGNFGIADHVTMVPSYETASVCAVGAGLLFTGVTIASCPVRSFARHYGVTTAYATGVSDGFEAHYDGRPGIGCGYGSDAMKRTRDYQRGYAVGVAVSMASNQHGRDLD